jgi:hypothetical protein
MHDRYLKRFDELEAEALAILANPEVRTVKSDGLWSMEDTHYNITDSGRFHQWQSMWATLVGQILPPTHPKSGDIRQMVSYSASESLLEEMLAILRAAKSDYVGGFFEDLLLLIHTEVAGDYMAQAELLLAEGYYVPAAVLAGAVLEDALRKLCDGKDIGTMKPSGERRSINPMNDDLAQAKVYNPAKAHEIRAWADIRNDCAHGDGGKVKPEDVGRMIQGVRAFVADYLK